MSRFVTVVVAGLGPQRCAPLANVIISDRDGQF